MARGKRATAAVAAGEDEVGAYSLDTLTDAAFKTRRDIGLSRDHSKLQRGGLLHPGSLSEKRVRSRSAVFRSERRLRRRNLIWEEVRKGAETSELPGRRRSEGGPP